MQIGGVVPERGNEPPRVPIYENDDAGTGGLRWRRVCTAHPREEIAMIPFRRILVPHDFSDSAAAALKLAATLIPADGGLLVLHVIVPFVPVTDLPVGAGGYIAPKESPPGRSGSSIAR